MVNLDEIKTIYSRRIVLAIKHGIQDVGKHLIRSLWVVSVVALGVALAMGIVSVANGVDDRVTQLLGGIPFHLDFSRVYGILNQSRAILTWLAYSFSAMSVFAITWVSMEKRRYAISAARSKGLTVMDMLVEYTVEAIVLCCLGGCSGIFLGYLMCQYIPVLFPLLPVHFVWKDVFHIFPMVSGLSFMVTFFITILLGLRPNPHPEM